MKSPKITKTADSKRIKNALKAMVNKYFREARKIVSDFAKGKRK